MPIHLPSLQEKCQSKHGRSRQVAKTGGNKEFTQNFGGEISSENTKEEDR
jgi:hypothetical protein